MTNKDVVDGLMERLQFIDPASIVGVKTDDFIDVLSDVCDNCEKYRDEWESQFTEIQRQKDDLEHILVVERMNGAPQEVIDDIQKKIGDTLIVRRTLRDACAAIRVTVENLSKTRAFLANMDSRSYMPKSRQYAIKGPVRASAKNAKIDGEYNKHLSSEYSSLKTTIATIPPQRVGDDDEPGATVVTSMERNKLRKFID